MYELRISQEAIRTLKKAPPEIASRIREKLNDLAENPFDLPNVKRLTRHAGFRLRVGDWRVLYIVEAKALVIQVIAIGHRKDVYR